MYREIEIEKLEISACNVRRRVDEKQIVKLAQDILKNGLHEPLVVRPEDGRYGVVIGGRRLRALRLVKEKWPEDFEKLFPGGKIPCIVKELSDKDAILISLSENYHKQSLSDEEYGEAIERLKNLGVSEDEVRDRIRMEVWEIKKAVELWEAVKKARAVPTAKPGRPPEKREKPKRVSRKALAKATTLARKLERRGVVKKPDEFVQKFVRKVSEKGLSTKEIELVAEKVKEEAPKAKGETELFEKLDQIIASIAAHMMVEKVVLLRKDIADTISNYARRKGKKFDEVLNEMLEAELRRRGLLKTK